MARTDYSDRIAWRTLSAMSDSSMLSGRFVEFTSQQMVVAQQFISEAINHVVEENYGFLRDDVLPKVEEIKSRCDRHDKMVADFVLAINALYKAIDDAVTYIGEGKEILAAVTLGAGLQKSEYVIEKYRQQQLEDAA